MADRFLIFPSSEKDVARKMRETFSFEGKTLVLKKGAPEVFRITKRK